MNLNNLGHYMQAQRQTSGFEDKCAQAVEAIKVIPPVVSELERLQKAIAETNGVIDLLAQRLTPVLTPQPVMSGEQEATPAPPRAPLVESIAGVANDALMATQRVRFLLDRLSI